MTRSHSDPYLDPISLGLPHRAPFLFVDGIVDLVPGTSAIGIKTFHADEPMFIGHFPGNPIVPGVILTEALAQLAGIAGSDSPSHHGFLLSAIRSMKFPRAIRPGEMITLKAEKTSDLGNLCGFDVSASVDDQLAAIGQVILSRNS